MLWKKIKKSRIESNLDLDRKCNRIEDLENRDTPNSHVYNKSLFGIRAEHVNVETHFLHKFTPQLGLKWSSMLSLQRPQLRKETVFDDTQLQVISQWFYCPAARLPSQSLSCPFLCRSSNCSCVICYWWWGPTYGVCSSRGLVLQGRCQRVQAAQRGSTRLPRRSSKASSKTSALFESWRTASGLPCEGYV